MAERKTAFPKFRKTLSTAMAALALGCAVGAADAALVTGRFDPDFGGALQDIGFEGTATFNINQKCLDNVNAGPTGAFIYSTYTDCGGEGAEMFFVGATVNFYSLVDHSSIGTVEFGEDLTAVLGMYVKNGQVTGVQTSLIGPATSSGLPLPVGDIPFTLLFGMLDPVIGNDEDHPPGNDDDDDLDDQAESVFQQTRMFALGGNCDLVANPNGCSSNIANTTYVPEPGSAALALAALLAAGGLRRRVG